MAQITILMRSLHLLFFILLCPIFLEAQTRIPWKNRGPIWFTPAQNTKIHGVSLGVFHFSFNPEKPTKVNGISVELGLGLLIAMGLGESISDANRNRIVEFDTVSCVNQINGLSLSLIGETIGFVSPGEVRGLSLSGSMGMIFRVRGVQLAPLGCVNWELRGLCASIHFNEAYRVRGVQIGVVTNRSGDHKGVQIAIRNYAKKMRGVQIGLWNKTRNLKGLQIGLWNINPKRSLPLVNWAR